MQRCIHKRKRIHCTWSQMDSLAQSMSIHHKDNRDIENIQFCKWMTHKGSMSHLAAHEGADALGGIGLV